MPAMSRSMRSLACRCLGVGRTSMCVQTAAICAACFAAWKDTKRRKHRFLLTCAVSYGRKICPSRNSRSVSATRECRRAAIWISVPTVLRHGFRSAATSPAWRNSASLMNDGFGIRPLHGMPGSREVAAFSPLIIWTSSSERATSMGLFVIRRATFQSWILPLNPNPLCSGRCSRKKRSNMLHSRNSPMGA